MVKAAYESGHPSIGVGAGNTPAVIDETADIPMAVSSILISKTFDNGVICASEQNIITVDSVRMLLLLRLLHHDLLQLVKWVLACVCCVCVRDMCVCVAVWLCSAHSLCLWRNERLTAVLSLMH
jgi:hypothetical protein